MTNHALSSLRVVEQAEFVSGPFCAKLLADLGADVVKVEPPEGDRARRYGPFPADAEDPEQSGLFLYLNTNKRGLVVDAASARGTDVLCRLLAEADLFIEDATPGSRGLGFADLQRLNPRLVMVSITPFGQTGPYAGFRAEPLNTVHAAAHGAIIRDNMRREEGRAELPPVRPGGLVGEYDAGVNAAIAALAAIWARDVTGRGQHVDVSKQESLIALERVELARLANEGRQRAVSLRVGGLLECRDGYIEAIVMQERHWAAFLRVMGDPEWSRDPAIATSEGRNAHAAEIQPRLEAWAREQSAEDVFRRAQALGAPVGRVRSPAEVRSAPQFLERGFFRELEHPAAGVLSYPGVPYRLSATPGGYERPAPLLGQHTDEILAERLGVAGGELAALRAEGAVA